MPSPRSLALPAAALLLVAGLGACSSPPDHPELAVQRTEGGSLVVHHLDCDDPQVDELRVVEEWGSVEQAMADYGRSALDAVDPALGPTALAYVQRNAWPPRLRFELEGDEPFDVTFDPDDVPPVDWQLLVPDAPKGDEIVDLEDFQARCD